MAEAVSRTKLTLLGVLLLLVTSSLVAHQDWRFPLGADGSIGKLPEGYGPGSLLVSDSVVKLALGAHENKLADCLVSIFQLPEGESIQLHGSAHHNLENLPPYLAIDLPEHTLESGGFNGYQLLFHLGTAKLLEVNRMEATPGPDGDLMGSTLRRVPAYAELCGGPEPRLVVPAPERCNDE